MSRETELADALEQLAREVNSQPVNITGVHIVAQGDGKGGNVTGLHIDMGNIVATGGGNFTGMNVTMNYDGTNPNAALIGELREAAASLREGQASKGWIKSLLERVDRLGIAALSASVAAATKLYLGLP